MANISQILQAAKSIDFMFDEFTRSARQEKLKAKFRGDMDSHRRIDKAWREARDAKEEALAILEKNLLSTEVVNSVLGELKGHKNDAKKFLEKLRKAQDVLATIEKVADMSIKLITRLRKIAAP